MTLASTIGFAIAMMILAASPGPAFFVLISRSLTKGSLAGVGVLTGVIVADVIFLILAILGMSAVSQAMGSAFVVIKIAGGAYLVWLGFKMWRQKPLALNDVVETDARGFYKNLLEGLAVNLTNPKAIVFFAALLPTFVDLESVTMHDGLVLTGIVVLTGICIDGFYIFLASKVAKWMRSEKAQRRLNCISGATLASVGVAVALR